MTAGRHAAFSSYHRHHHRRHRRRNHQHLLFKGKGLTVTQSINDVEHVARKIT